MDQMGVCDMKIKSFALVAVLMLLPTFHSFAQTSSYEDTVKQWHSYEDVAKWMEANFIFVKKKDISVQMPEATFIMKRGYCKDGAVFAMDALNKINPKYDAKLIYIQASHGTSSHYVTGFKLKDKLYFMDYASGSLYSAISGTHGPFDSITELAEYIKKKGISGSVYFVGGSK